MCSTFQYLGHREDAKITPCPGLTPGASTVDLHLSLTMIHRRRVSECDPLTQVFWTFLSITCTKVYILHLNIQRKKYCGIILIFSFYFHGVFFVPITFLWCRSWPTKLISKSTNGSLPVIWKTQLSLLY